MADWKSGNVVMLKSGGPRMTVEELDEDDEWQCVWFVGGKTQRDAFPPRALKAVAEATTPTTPHAEEE